jgi:hypothetical protein
LLAAHVTADMAVELFASTAVHTAPERGDPCGRTHGRYCQRTSGCSSGPEARSLTGPLSRSGSARASGMLAFAELVRLIVRTPPRPAGRWLRWAGGRAAWLVSARWPGAGCRPNTTYFRCFVLPEVLRSCCSVCVLVAVSICVPVWFLPACRGGDGARFHGPLARRARGCCSFLTGQVRAAG